jgi:hypothetical protein
MPVASGRTRKITGCARRMLGERLKDAGSIPATSKNALAKKVQVRALLEVRQAPPGRAGRGQRRGVERSSVVLQRGIDGRYLEHPCSPDSASGLRHK